VIEQETRYFDPHLDRTVRLRSKEDEVDYRYRREPPSTQRYLAARVCVVLCVGVCRVVTQRLVAGGWWGGARYFPEPDLPPLAIEEGLVEQIRAELPELPDDKCRRLVADYDLPLYDAQVLVDTYGATHFFEAPLSPPPVLPCPSARLPAL
jgi:Asp-tRNA(Asn)/Glu-tRNA(Gln) amidotransferase B subunit